MFVAVEGTQLYAVEPEPLFSNLELGLIISISIIAGLVIIGKFNWVDIKSATDKQCLI